MSIAYQ